MANIWEKNGSSEQILFSWALKSLGMVTAAIKLKDTWIAGWLLSKSLQAINAGEGVEKREPSYTVGGNAN